MGTPGFFTPLEWCFSEFVVSFCGCWNEREIFVHSLSSTPISLMSSLDLRWSKIKVPAAPRPGLLRYPGIVLLVLHQQRDGRKIE